MRYVASAPTSLWVFDLHEVPPLLLDADRQETAWIEFDAKINVLPVHSPARLRVGVFWNRFHRRNVGHVVHSVVFAIEPADAADGSSVSFVMVRPILAAADPACSLATWRPLAGPGAASSG